MTISKLQGVLLIFGVLLSIFLFILVISPRIRFIVRSKIHLPGRKSKYVKTVLKDELNSAKIGQKYDTLESFMKDCPDYCVNTDFLGKMIRNILRAAGINYQQYVFIRKNATKDKTVYIRRDEEDKILIHSKGTYALPADYSKDVIYYDVDDMRPLIDVTNEEDWKNPDTCADVVTAITNSKTMAGLSGKNDMNVLALISIGVTVLAIFGIIALYYQSTQQDKMITEVWNLVNSTRRP